MSMSPTGATTGYRNSPPTAGSSPPTAHRAPAKDSSAARPGVCVDADGYIYVSDWGNERVQLLAPDGAFVQSLRGQATLSRWAQDFMSVNPDEYNTRRMSNLTPELPSHLDTPYLISAQTEPYFWGPVSVRLDASERLFVVEANRHRIQVYQRQKA